MESRMPGDSRAYDGAPTPGASARAKLQELLGLACADPSLEKSLARELAQEVAFSGDDPLYASPFRLGTAAAVALAAAGVACDALRPRPGRHPGAQASGERFAIDLPAAALSTASFRLLHLDGNPVVSPRDALTGFYRCRDGANIFLHLNFPHHRARAQSVLGTLASREAIAAQVQGWDGAALEQALVEAGACAAIVQDPSQWQRCDQARAMAGVPPIEILKIADGPPQPLPSSPPGLPLAGIDVVDFTRVLAGPVSGRTLADLGARVTRIIHPEYPDLRSYELDTARDKSSCQLDLRQKEGRERLLAMIRKADVFQMAYRPGVAERFGLTPEALAAIRPGLIHTSLSAFGPRGPWAARRGFDSLVQAPTGIAMTEGGGTPRLLPTSPIDYVSGYLLAFGTAVALRRRATEGGSYLVRGSLASTAQWIIDLGLVTSADAAQSAERVAALARRLTVESATPWGRLSHLPSPLRRLDGSGN